MFRKRNQNIWLSSQGKPNKAPKCNINTHMGTQAHQHYKHKIPANVRLYTYIFYLLVLSVS